MKKFCGIILWVIIFVLCAFFSQDFELENRTIYVNLDSINGDIEGDGSINNPFRTPYKALTDINPIIYGCSIEIFTKGSQYNWPADSMKWEISQKTFRNGGNIIFIGEIISLGYLTLIQDNILPTKYWFNSDIGVDSLAGKFINIGTDKKYPISSNDSTSLFAVKQTNEGNRNIIDIKTKFVNYQDDISWLDFTTQNEGGGYIKFQNVDLQFPPEYSNHRAKIFISNIQLVLFQCRYSFPIFYDASNLTYNEYKNIIIRECYNGYNSTLENNFRGNTYINIRESVIRSLGSYHFFNFQQNDFILFAGNIVENCEIRLTNNVKFITKLENTFHNSETAFVIQSGSQIYGDDYLTEFIFDSINYLISYGDGNSYSNELITGGVLGIYGNYDHLSKEIPGYKLLEKHIINIPGLWQKDERIAINILNNTSGPIEIGDTLQNKTIYIDYSISRNKQVEMGTIMLTGLDDNVINYVNSMGDVGIEFSKNISRSTIRLDYTLSDAIYNAELNMIVKRIFN